MKKNNVVLILGADKRYCRKLKRILSRGDLLITSASSFDELKQAGPTITPNLILIDKQYHLLEGAGGLAQIRDYFDDPAIKIVFIADKKRPEEIDKMILQGADDIMIRSLPDYIIAGKVQVLLRNFEQVKSLVDEKTRLTSSNVAQLNLLKKLRESSKKLEALSYRDGLTELFNQRYLAMKLKSEFERARRYKRHLSCLLIDLDYFKAVNYTYGHQSGDGVLKEVAQLITGAARSIDLIFRKGGDEFTMLLPDTPLEGALNVAGRIHNAIGHHSFLKDSHNIRMTASVGTASFSQKDFSSAKELFDAADKAASEAKKTGGDKVLSWKDEPSPEILSEESSMRIPSKKLNELTSKYLILQRDVKEEYILATRNWLDTLKRSDLLLRHHDRVASVSLKLGRNIELKANELDTLRFAASFFDIGKVNVWETIILKPGKITPREYARVKRHPVTVVNFMKRAPFFAQEVPIILHHHERWDGTGYPDGLEGENIPLGSRIIAVADAFDAMTSDLPYSPPKPVEDAAKELDQCAGSQFDPDIVGTFMALLKDGELLETG